MILNGDDLPTVYSVKRFFVHMNVDTAQFLVLLCLLRKESKFGKGVALSALLFELVVDFLGGLGRFFPCTGGRH